MNLVTKGELYSASLNNKFLTDDIVEDFNNLKEDKDYFKFLVDYGTHFLYKVTLGAKR